ncbi:MAG: hypothetical protein ABSE18_02290 [Minisyncoccia bacterium]
MPKKFVSPLYRLVHDFPWLMAIRPTIIEAWRGTWGTKTHEISVSANMVFLRDVLDARCNDYPFEIWAAWGQWDNLSAYQLGIQQISFPKDYLGCLAQRIYESIGDCISYIALVQPENARSSDREIIRIYRPARNFTWEGHRAFNGFIEERVRVFETDHPNLPKVKKAKSRMAERP